MARKAKPNFKKLHADMEKDRDKFYDLYHKEREERLRLESEEKRRQDGTLRDLQGSLHTEKAHNAQLLEIIRWQINPRTSNFPFDKDKEQKSESDLRSGRIGY